MAAGAQIRQLDCAGDRDHFRKFSLRKSSTGCCASGSKVLCASPGSVTAGPDPAPQEFRSSSAAPARRVERIALVVEHQQRRSSAVRRPVLARLVTCKPSRHDRATQTGDGRERHLHAALAMPHREDVARISPRRGLELRHRIPKLVSTESKHAGEKDRHGQCEGRSSAVARARSCPVARRRSRSGAGTVPNRSRPPGCRCTRA